MGSKLTHLCLYRESGNTHTYGLLTSLMYGQSTPTSELININELGDLSSTCHDKALTRMGLTFKIFSSSRMQTYRYNKSIRVDAFSRSKRYFPRANFWSFSVRVIFRGFRPGAIPLAYCPNTHSVTL